MYLARCSSLCSLLPPGMRFQSAFISLTQARGYLRGEQPLTQPEAGDPTIGA